MGVISQGSIVIREARYEDAEAIAAIYNYYVLNSVVTFEESEITIEETSNRIRKVRQASCLLTRCQCFSAGYAAIWA